VCGKRGQCDGDHRVQTRSVFVFSYTHPPRASRPPLVAHRPWHSHVDLGPSLSHSWLSLKSPESLSMHAQPRMLHPCASRNHRPGLHMHASASRAQARPGEFDQEVVCGVSVCARSRLVPLIHHQPLALEALSTSPFESPFFASNLEQRVLSTNLYQRCDTSLRHRLCISAFSALAHLTPHGPQAAQSTQLHVDCHSLSAFVLFPPCQPCRA